MLLSMSKKFNIAQQIKRLKIGEFFFVRSEKDRQLASRECGTLRRAGIVDFDVTTQSGVDPKLGSGWNIIAIPPRR